MTNGFSIIIPTAGRQRYLAGALDDLAAQRFPAERFEIVVVDDSREGTSREIVRQFADRSPVRIRLVARRGQQGLNAARNTGIEEAEGSIVAFVDDDCRFDRAWLAELARGIEAAPRAEAFGGPIVVSLNAGHPRWCRREPFPITSLDRGPIDRYVDVVYGANMAVRRSAFERIGLFDPDQPTGPGDETEWILRLRRGGGLVRYVARAAVRHTRFAEDVTLRELLRAAHRRARCEAAFDHRQRLAPREAAVLTRGLRMTAHALRRRCWSALAHSTESFTYVFYSASAAWRRR